MKKFRDFGLCIFYFLLIIFHEVNAPASRTYEHCKTWVEQGCKVTVITGAPNFPKGKVLKVTKIGFSKEKLDGIEVIRVWTFIAPNKGTFKRIIDYLSFMLMSFLVSLFIKKPNIIIGTSPQFFTVCAAFLCAFLRRVPWVFELRDLWPESVKVVGSLKDSFFIRFMEKIEIFLYKRADAIIAVTNSFRLELVNRGIDKTKISVVTNGVDFKKFHKRDKDSQLISDLKIENKFVLGYIGTLGLAHCLETILYAAEKLQYLDCGRDVQFILVGDGAEKSKLQKLAKNLKLKNLLFIDTVSKDQVVRYWSILDYSIIHLKDKKLFETVIPSKMFESIGMGIPILHGVKGESASMVADSSVGKLFEPENVVSLVNAITEARAAPDITEKLKTNALVESLKYDREALAKKMLEIVTTTADKAFKH